jgi:hypothetical protein
VVHLGSDSDPRFLSAVPDRWPFFRACWLDLACPSYKGRLLYTSDVAYVFGEPPRPRDGAQVVPGRCVATVSDKGFARGNGRNKAFGAVEANLPHPTPRKLQHVKWLVKWFGGDCVLDPFAGSGTTLLAAKLMGVRAIGIEIERRFCDLTVQRLAQRVLFQPE